MDQITDAGPALTPVAKVTSAQQAATQILAMIRRGAFVPGDRLPTEKELCERLGIGRSTVREALQIMATLNVVQPMPGQGTFIKAPTTADVLRADLIGFLIGEPMALELLEAREMIEPTVARLACLRGTEADFARIDRLLDEHTAAHARGAPVSEYAARFHVLLAEAAHNRVAVIFMSSILELLMQRGRRFDHDLESRAREITEHRDLLAILRSRDADRAAEALLRHIVDAAATFDVPDPRTRPEAGPVPSPAIPRPRRKTA